MNDIVDIDKYKAAKLAKAEADFNRYMTQAEQFTAEGRNGFAKQMIEKAKEARKVIDKFRKRPSRTPEPTPTYIVKSINYQFQASADLGYPKPSPTPSID